MEEFVPHPLDLSTLFDFLKLLEEGDDDPHGHRKMSTILLREIGNGSFGGSCFLLLLLFVVVLLLLFQRLECSRPSQSCCFC